MSFIHITWQVKHFLIYSSKLNSFLLCVCTLETTSHCNLVLRSQDMKHLLGASASDLDSIGGPGVEAGIKEQSEFLFPF